MNALGAALREAFGTRARRDAPLAPHTTFKVGGTADWLVEVHGAVELSRILDIVRREGSSLTVLGGGSNVLIADTGVRGVVVRIHGGQLHRVGDDVVRADAGVTINGLVRWTISHGLGGVEMWAGTPGTVGGAVFGNAHFQGRLISERISQVTVLTRAGVRTDIPSCEMEFGYDYSRLHRTREVVLSADFDLHPGDVSELRQTARESLRFRKRTQPLALSSAGCIFQNPDPARDLVPAGVPPSAGALVDRSGLKGEQEGGAMVSPVHANFIVNEGTATARDIKALIERCKAAVRERFGVELREEIVYLGFEDERDAGSGVGLAEV
jgi:UDP-N-acetylmuramate dehydrogenase